MNGTFEAAPRDVERAFAAVFPHVGANDHLPSICCVHVELDGTSMRLAATDRYTLAVYRAELTEWVVEGEDVPALDPLKVNFFARDLRTMFAFARRVKKDRATWTVTAEGLSVQLSPHMRASIPAVETSFFDYRQVFDGLATAAGQPRSEYLNVAPDKLARFATSAAAVKVDRHDTSAVVVWAPTSPLKPVPVTIGDRFAGLIMPIRRDEAPTLDFGPVLGSPSLPAGGVS